MRRTPSARVLGCTIQLGEQLTVDVNVELSTGVLPSESDQHRPTDKHSSNQLVKPALSCKCCSLGLRLLFETFVCAVLLHKADEHLFC